MELSSKYTLLYQWVIENLNSNPAQFMIAISGFGLVEYVREYSPSNILVNGFPDDRGWEIQLSESEGWEIRITPS